MSFTIGSLFDGSGGFPLAASMCGGVPKWAAEVEPYPISVTKPWFPDMKHLGSVTDIKGSEVEPVDVLTFGAPCQDLSVAGLRKGLRHGSLGDEETTRSGLFMEAVRIIKEMREATNGVYPRFAIYENVPGAFSSSGGEDFRIVLEELIKIVEPTAVMPEVPKNGWPYADSYCGDGWSIAYRVLDAQFWGVPQRRRRIYLVADFRGECAGKVSFECEGLRGYFETGRTPWQTAAGDAEIGFGAADCERNAVTYSINHQGGNVEQIIEDKTGTLTAAMNSSGNNKLSVAYGVTTKGNGDALASNSMKSSNPHSGCRQVDVSKCLDTTDPNPSKNQGGIAIVERVGIVDSIGGQAERGWEGETAPCLKASHYKFAPVVAYPAVGVDVYNQTLTSRMGTGGGNVHMVMEPMLAPGKNATGCLMASGYGKLGAQEMFSGDYTVVEKQPVFCQQENGIDRADTAGCNGKGVKEDICYTLNTIDRPAVAYSLETFHCTSEEEKTTTLKARDYKDPGIVCYGVDCRNATEYPESMGAIQATMNHSLNSNGVVRIQYIVRRLTPTECARLQGFPDTWGHPIEKTELTDEEYQFWLNVRNTHAAINDKATKDYSKNQILKWYNDLHTDSSEYKMWGNGIALPNALYVMQGIADVMSEEKATRRKWLDELLGDCL